MRSPTVKNPATPDEIQRAFYGPTVYAPGGTPEQAAAAQQRLSERPAAMNQAVGMRPEEIDAEGRLMGTIGNQNPSRQTLASRVKLIDGQQYLANGRPAYGSGARNLQTSRVGAGTMSNGMTGGGAIGSSLMMSGAAVPGMAMGAAPPQPRQSAVNAFETAKATATGMQRPPTVMQTDDGGARIFGSGAVMLKPNEAQAAKRSAFADKLSERRDAVTDRGESRGQARDERMQFASDAQTMGRGPALIRAFERKGIAPERAAAMMQGNMQFLSEDNRQQRAAGEAGDRTQIERDRLKMEQEGQKFQQDWLGRQPQPMDEQVIQLQQSGQAAYDAAIAAEKTPQEAQAAAMQASMGKWQQFGTQTPGATGKPQGGPSTTGAPGGIIAALEASGDPQQRALGARMRQQNQALENARRRSEFGGLRGGAEDAWNIGRLW